MPILTSKNRMDYSCKVFLLLVIVLTCSCKSVNPLTYSSTDKKLEGLINRSLEYFGGVKKHQSIARLAYKKEVVLYKEDGQIDREIFEQHRYNYREGNFSINKKIAGSSSEFHMKNGAHYALVDGKRNEAASIETTFNTAFYVIGMPFKFLDEGVALELIEEENNIYSIQADYNPTTNPNHAGSEKWIYSIEKTGNITQQIAYSSDHISLIKNDAYHTIDDYKFIKKRTSYRVNDKHDILYKRADYKYYDLEIDFK